VNTSKQCRNQIRDHTSYLKKEKAPPEGASEGSFKRFDVLRVRESRSGHPGIVATGSGRYLIPAFNQIQQERPRELSLFRQEHEMVAMNFNRVRFHTLERTAGEADQEGLIRHETVFG
jgi:hypothetical protein